VALTLAAFVALVGLFALTIAGAGSDVLAMDGSMPDGGSGVALTVAGSVACTFAMAAMVYLAVAGGRGHHRTG